MRAGRRAGGGQFKAEAFGPIVSWVGDKVANIFEVDGVKGGLFLVELAIPRYHISQ